MPLAQVPDPVFAQGMAGDGVAIDPTEGVLRAPCDGELVSMKDAKHAITLRTGAGVDVLVHVGIDTVALAGRGFERLVEPGGRVRAGDALVRFDLDLLAHEAKSLASPVLAIGGGRILRRAPEGPIAAGDFLLEVQAEAQSKSAASPAPASVARATCTVIVPFEHGLHARPAAQLAAALRPFPSDVRFVFRGREANARSTVAMMSLGVRAGEAIEAWAIGDDAGAALAMLERSFAPAPGVPAETKARAALPGRLAGVVASRGLAAGPCA
jgi:phosphotransferase system HPr (HPr) family protein